MSFHVLPTLIERMLRMLGPKNSPLLPATQRRGRVCVAVAVVATVVVAAAAVVFAAAVVVAAAAAVACFRCSARMRRPERTGWG